MTDYRTLPARIEPAKFDTTLHFDWTTPPLHANKKWSHWAPKAAMVKKIRAESKRAADRIPPLGKCSVTLTWVVTDRRVRDEDNLWPLAKAYCDGLVDAGVVLDDRPEYMTKPAPIIRWQNKAEGPAHMELRIEQL